MVSRNVATLVDAPRVPRHEIRPLTPEQARQLIETSTEDRYRGLWITALGTGLRQGELLGLGWEDVDLEAGRLRVRHTLGNVEGTLTLLEPKTDRSRRLVMLPTVVVEALRAHRTRQKMDRLVAGSRWTDSGHVFATHAGPAASCGHHHPGLPGRSRSCGPARHPLPRPAPLRSHVPPVPGLHARGRKEAPQALVDRPNVEHVRAVLEQRQRLVARGMDAVLGG